MYKTLLPLFLSMVLLSACGGSSDSGSTTTGGTDTGTDTTDTTVVDTGTPADVENFVPADGIASYTGDNQLADLNTGNSRDFLGLLFSPGLQAPGTSLRSETPAIGIQLAGDDFLRSQETLLRDLKQKALVQHQYSQRSVDVSDSDSCGGTGGYVHLSGELYESVGKGKLKLEYVNCQSGGYVLNGDAYLLIYAIHGSFNEFSSSTLSYNGLQADLLSSDETLSIVGTVDEVVDFDTGSVRVTSKLHREFANTGQQSLTDVIRLSQGVDGAVEMTGNLYEGFFGRVQVTTLQRLIYNDVGSPIAGYILLTGLDNSKIAVTALGEQYNTSTGLNEIMLQVDVDADGDGYYENVSQIDAGGL
uniref:Lipoprotein n=1 Tax=uncultured Thiotrichaceae bacterium TaxID=298394 RepID=A0A6S6UFN8_9GAMM|nr:MAG: Unknown protein [uncultured Thiotrichaceae bacterium]